MPSHPKLEAKRALIAKPNDVAISDSKLFIYTIGLLLSSVVNSIQFKRITTCMTNYISFLSQLNNAAYVPVFGLILIYMYMREGVSAFGGDAVRTFPLYKFWIIGFLDGLGGILATVGGSYTTGSTQAILSQVVIPVAMAISIPFLRRTYHWLQYTGAIIIICGISISKLYKSHYTGRSNAMTDDDIVYNIIFVLGTVPMALSALYKEFTFNHVKMHVNYMQYWVSHCQFLLGFLIMGLMALPILGEQRVNLRDIPTNFRDGYYCMTEGRNVITQDCGGPNQRACDDCQGAGRVVLCYLFANMWYNVFTVLVVKHGGATVSFLVSTLRLPLTTFAFSSPLFVGKGQTAALTPYDIIGLTVLIVGLITYRTGSLYRNKPSSLQVHFFCCTLDSVPALINVESNDEAAKATREALYNRLFMSLINTNRYTPPIIPDDVFVHLSEAMKKKYEGRVLSSDTQSDAFDDGFPVCASSSESWQHPGHHHTKRGKRGINALLNEHEKQ